ncbi:AraC family transcriptional regulator [Paenibacillus physcomitrellae]|uniref:HTH-type transcriptional regulator YdeE n=1 Tax=Paenibacillus physcomitrellae TaxID=1619311 RepID=A0ABQ1FPK0_9BACL|nr:GyrI-like domain-containing protein [Paenibacillus physcomitrellae]GGA24438.1 putative HTH-type transcriptional regulator YdeE [Paenibacillus physcomitrellae]
MNTLEPMNQAMVYIEENLAGEIDYKEIARLALCSEYHFKRMFSFLSGIPLSEYIRRRRLTLAAVDLQHTANKIIDIALTYGYNSPDAFTKAFQNFHGVTPSDARAKGKDQPLKSFPRMTFQLTIKGGKEMNYRIVEQEAFRIAGLKKRVRIQFEGVNPEIASMWESLDEAKIKRLKELSGREPYGLISASTNFSEGRMEEQGELDHFIGAATTKACPEDMDCLEVNAGTWAVFTAVGPFPQALQEVWGQIYAEWFPSSGYEAAEGPEILWNESSDVSSPHFKSEIWMPVRRTVRD